MLDQCIATGVSRIIIITQGFADADKKGRRCRRKSKEGPRQTRAHSGPNTMGVLNNFKKFTTSFIDVVRPETFSPVSLIAQTGLFQVASQDMAYNIGARQLI